MYYVLAGVLVKLTYSIEHLLLAVSLIYTKSFFFSDKFEEWGQKVGLFEIWHIYLTFHYIGNYKDDNSLRFVQKLYTIMYQRVWARGFSKAEV